MTDSSQVHVVCARGRQRLEPVATALICRGLVRAGSLQRALRLLDRLPTRPATKRALEMPQPHDFRGAGACLALSLARSQYLRRRGITSTIAIGARSVDGELDAHAWLEPFDDDLVHSVLHRIDR